MTSTTLPLSPQQRTTLLQLQAAREQANDRFLYFASAIIQGHGHTEAQILAITEDGLSIAPPPEPPNG